MKFDISELDVVADVLSCFEEEKSVRAVKEAFHEELNDPDDAPLVYIGLGVAHLQQGKKIGVRLKDKILQVLHSEDLNARFYEERCYSDFLEWKEDFEKEIREEKPPVVKKRKNTSFYRKFYAKVNVGDIYAYRIKEEDGTLSDRWALYRILEKEDNQKDLLVYLLCIPDFTIPKTEEEMSKAIYLPCSRRFGNFDYIFRLIRGEENTEETGRLVLVGNYPSYSPPLDEVRSPDPLLYGYVRQDYLEVHVEKGIRILKKCGLWNYR